MNLPDLIRVITFGQAAIVVVLSIWVVIRYTIKIFKAEPNDRALPIHIALVGTSYLGLIVSHTCEIYARAGQPLTWRSYSGLILFGLGDAALMFMMIHLSMKRTIVTAVLAKAREEAAIEAVRLAANTERHRNRMEDLAGRTHDHIVEMHEDTAVAADKAAVAVTKAENIEEVGTDTNKRVRNMENGTGGKKTK